MYTNEFNDNVGELEPTLALFRAARFAYRTGSPIMSDFDYDILERQIKQLFPQAEELHQVYENDKVIPNELRQFGIDELSIEIYGIKREFKPEFKYPESDELLSEENTSIISMKTDDEVYAEFQKYGIGEYILTPKIDGIFIATVYEKDEKDGNYFNLTTAVTRGDDDSRYDITKAISNILPIRIPMIDSRRAIRISGEGIFDADNLDKTNYVTQRTACFGVMASTVNDKIELQQYVNFYAHGGVTSSEYEGTLNSIGATGIKTVPMFKFTFDQAIQNTEDLTFKLQPVVNKIITWSQETKNEVDGIVVTKVSEDNSEIKTKGNKVYRKGVFAIKSGFWNKGLYKSEVIAIEAEQQDSRVSYKLIVKPVKAANGFTLTKVTDLNLSTLIRDEIKVNDSVAFSYLNSTTIKYLYKVKEEDEDGR